MQGDNKDFGYYKVVFGGVEGSFCEVKDSENSVTDDKGDNEELLWVLVKFGEERNAGNKGVFA